MIGLILAVMAIWAASASPTDIAFVAITVAGALAAVRYWA